MNTTRANIIRLAACQALLLTDGITLIAINGLAGYALAPDKHFATVPIMAYVIGSALSTLPASHLMKHYGRRAGFLVGSSMGMIGALIGACSLFLGNFWLLCLGAFASGIYNAIGQYYRFAAADMAPANFKSRAISLVLTGGILGGVLGPESGKLTRELLAPPFFASFLLLALFALISLLTLRGLDLPRQSVEERRSGGRPLALIARQPAFIVAVIAAAGGYAIMILLMSATPLAMHLSQHPFADSAFVLEWHVIGMFAPSFFTGALIQRFGVINILLCGAGLMLACVSIAITGVSLMHFWGALLLLGIGWNFLYIGGTTLLTETYEPAERAKTQGTNDFIVFAAMAISSMSSGLILTQNGWGTLNLAALPLITVVIIAIVTLWFRRRGMAPA